jgi:hypothetical protein
MQRRRRNLSKLYIILIERRSLTRNILEVSRTVKRPRRDKEPYYVQYIYNALFVVLKYHGFSNYP